MNALSERKRAANLLRAFFAPEIKAWRGEMALVKVYWGYGVGVSGLLGLFLLEALREGRSVLEQGLLAALALYTVWILVSVWRCAAHAPPQWRMLARLSTVVWACNAALVLSFLQFDLIMRFVSR
jgi:hypothetical protein